MSNILNQSWEIGIQATGQKGAVPGLAYHSEQA